MYHERVRVPLYDCLIRRNTSCSSEIYKSTKRANRYTIQLISLLKPKHEKNMNKPSTTMYGNKKQQSLSRDNQLHRSIFIIPPLAICIAATIITNTSPVTAGAAFGGHSIKHGTLVNHRVPGFEKSDRLNQKFGASPLSSPLILQRQNPLHRRRQSKLKPINTYNSLSSSSALSLGSSLFPPSNTAINKSNEVSSTLFKKGNTNKQRRQSALSQVSSTMVS